MRRLFDPVYETASNFFVKGEYHSALGSIMDALRIRPDDCNALRLAAAIMAGLNDSEAALSYINRAIFIQPNDADLHDTKAGVLIGADAFAAAEVEARIALGIAKEQRDVPLVDGLDFIYITLVDALAQQGKLKEAKEAFDEGIDVTGSEFLESVGRKILE